MITYFHLANDFVYKSKPHILSKTYFALNEDQRLPKTTLKKEVYSNSKITEDNIKKKEINSNSNIQIVSVRFLS